LGRWDQPLGETVDEMYALAMQTTTDTNIKPARPILRCFTIAIIVEIDIRPNRMKQSVTTHGFSVIPVSMTVTSLKSNWWLV